MSRSLNRASLIGNLGKDPEIRRTQSGARVASFSVATSERWKDKTTGEDREYTEWHKVVIINDGLAGVVENLLRKGSKVFVEGQLKTRKWTDDQGIERHITEIVVRSSHNSRLDILDGFKTGDTQPPMTEAEIADMLDDSIPYQE